MIVIFKDREPQIDNKLVLGNRGDIKATTITFTLDRVQNDLDLSTFSPSIEWHKSLGGQDIVEGLTSTVDSTDNSLINIEWTLPKEIMETPGSGNICIAFYSEDKVFRTSNVPIYVKNTINVEETLIPSLPPSYRVFLDTVEANKAQIETNTQAISTNKTNIDKKLDAEQEDWFYPAMLNKALSTTDNRLRYKKDQLGTLHVVGEVYNSDGSMPCFTLVDGYKMGLMYFRPTSKNGNVLEMARIESNGDVYVTIPDNDIAYINLILMEREV